MLVLSFVSFGGVFALFLTLFVMLFLFEPLEINTLKSLAHDTYLQHVLKFTLGQAVLSTLLSVLISIPLAKALLRLNSNLRGIAHTLLGTAFVLPTVIVALAITALYGPNGPIEIRQFFGLRGILLAHLFFNVPLITKGLLEAWMRIPYNTWRLVSSLGMTSLQKWFFIDWPLLKKEVPHLLGVVFLVCLSSFTVVMLLGAGPATNTLEVAIYQALHFDFDLGKAAFLALLQIMLGWGVLAMLPLHSSKIESKRLSKKNDATSKAITLAFPKLITKILDSFLIALATLFISLPLVGMGWKGLQGPWIKVFSQPILYEAILNSLYIGATATIVALGCTIIWTLATQRTNAHMEGVIKGAESLLIACPSVVLSTGILLVIRNFEFSTIGIFTLVGGINGIIVLPFIRVSLAAGISHAYLRYQTLCQTLGLSWWQRVRWVYFPLSIKSLSVACGVAVPLSVSNFGVFAFLGENEHPTLPHLIYEYMGEYRLPEAAVVAAVLLALCLGIFFYCERVGKYELSRA